MYRFRRDVFRRRSRVGAIVAASAIIAFAAAPTTSIAHAADPPALGKAVAVNDTLPRTVLAGVTQPGVAQTPEATAARIGFFTLTPTETTLNFSIVSQTNAVAAAGYSSSTALYLLTADGGTYRASTLPDGTFGVSQSNNGVWTAVGTATFAVDGQVTEIDVQVGPWTASRTTAVIIRRDLDASNNGFETATPPILLDALSTVGYGGSIPLLDRGTTLGADGLTNSPCLIPNMPTVTLDAATSAVTFTFPTPPAADVRGTIGGVSLVDLVNPPYISGRFGDALWTGMRDQQPVGEFTVVASGNTVTVTTANDQGSIFEANHQALTIGISDPSGCYSLSPAVPFSLLLAPAGATVNPPTTIAEASTLPATTATTVASAGVTSPTSATGVTTTLAPTPARETFDNSDDNSTPWTAIIVVGVLAVFVGIGGGMLLSRRDRRKREARDALFAPRSTSKPADAGVHDADLDDAEADDTDIDEADIDEANIDDTDIDHARNDGETSDVADDDPDGSLR